MFEFCIYFKSRTNIFFEELDKGCSERDWNMTPDFQPEQLEAGVALNRDGEG